MPILLMKAHPSQQHQRRRRKTMIHTSIAKRTVFLFLYIVWIFSLNKATTTVMSFSRAKRRPRITPTFPPNDVSSSSHSSHYYSIDDQRGQHLLWLSLSTSSLVSSSVLWNNNPQSLFDDIQQKPTASPPSFTSDIRSVQKQVTHLLKNRKYRAAQELVKAAWEYWLQQQEGEQGNNTNQDTMKERQQLLFDDIDHLFQAYYNSAFSPPFRGLKARKRIELGIQLLYLQLGQTRQPTPSNSDPSSPPRAATSKTKSTNKKSPSLLPLHNTVPKRTLLRAVKALTASNEEKRLSSFGVGPSTTDTAFRLLQRLVTGKGVREQQASNAKSTTNTATTTAASGTFQLFESDFNMVLNAYSNVGRMDMAHRVLALQERAPHAPELSAVAYSILLKGYGRLKDLNNVDMLIKQAAANQVETDIIMMNSLIDAYINCNCLSKAREVFYFIRDASSLSPLSPSPDSRTSSSTWSCNSTWTLGRDELFVESECPAPNSRTYNTFLKGLACRGFLDEALDLSKEMRRLGVWDAVTTNTLVLAAVNAQDFVTTERLLREHTSIDATKQGETPQKHPNIEAYTTAINGYAQVGYIKKALDLFALMKEYKVKPNVYTYTALVGAFARNGKYDEATKMITYMEESVGLSATTITYNAILSGLAQQDTLFGQSEVVNSISWTLQLLQRMLKENLSPDPITVSHVVEIFAKTDPPRVEEASRIIDQLEEQGIQARRHARVGTALIHAYGSAADLRGAFQCFHQIRKPDLVSVNALLDTCLKCNEVESASDVFTDHFDADNSRLRPNVVSFTGLIQAYLSNPSAAAHAKGRKLYEEMKYRWRILPDSTIVDLILKSISERAKDRALTSTDVRFVVSVLRDAEKLDWFEGQLEKRKQAVQTTISKFTPGLWIEEVSLFGLQMGEEDGELFQRYGWNQVDSGFSLWGANAASAKDTPTTDDFFQERGWNTLESGFRII